MKKFLLSIIVSLLIVMIVYYGKAFIDNNFAKKFINKTYDIVEAATSQNNSNIVINEQASGEKGTFYLGMTRQEVLKILNKMKVGSDSIDSIYITNDLEDWNHGDEVMMVDKIGCIFTFDKKGKLYSIDINDIKEIPTILGLKFGDSPESMVKLYGKDFTLYKNTDFNIYEYKIGDHYFQVLGSISNNKIVGWRISKYDYEKELHPYTPDTDQSPISKKVLKFAYASYLKEFPGGKELPSDKQDEEIAKAESLAEEGFSLYKAHKDIAAVAKYEEALTHYATGEIYYNYGNSLSNIPSRLEDAVKAYGIAEEVFFYKLNLVQYNLACVFSKMHKSESAFGNLEMAIKNGYSNFAYIEKDEDLVWLRSQPQWKDWWAKYKK